MRNAKSTLLSRKTLTLKWLFGASGTVIALAMVAVWLDWPRSGSARDVAKDILTKTGYLEIEPPNTLSGPGTINTIEILGDGSVALHPTCETSPEFLGGKLQRSRTVDQDLTHKIEKKLDASGEIKKVLAAVAGINKVESVHVRLENASILLATDELLLSARHNLLKGGCEEAVMDNIAQGGIVCQTRAVLEADVAYEVGYNAAVTMEERAHANALAAAKLNMDARQGSTDRIYGRALFVGVRLSPSAIVASSNSGGAITHCRF